MSSGQRLGVKMAALVLPAIVLVGGIRLFAADLRSFGTKLTAPANLPERVTGHTFEVPQNWKHREPLQRWTTDFIMSLAVDHGEAFGFSPTPALNNLTITVHVDPARLKEEIEGAPTVDGAWFKPAARKIILDATRDTTEFADLKKQLSHQLVHAILQYQPKQPRWPGWMVEGLAQVFETSELGERRINARRVKLLSPPLQPGALEGLQKGDRMLETSYALVLYLIHGPHREAFLGWLKDELKSDKPAGGLEKILESSKFEEEWLAWCRAPILDR